MNLLIREGLPSDVAAIHDLTRVAFFNAPHTAHTEQFILDALFRADALTISLVAEQEGKVVGHAVASF